MRKQTSENRIRHAILPDLWNNTHPYLP